ncbi:MAG TPA: ThuA domain-containing protein, partial [Vicinamibacterales bacterium]
AIFLASTTGAFLDDPNDAAATAARRKALLEFVRGGKGLAGIHAATDSYHESSTQAAGRGGRGGGGIGAFLAPAFMAQGDKNNDQKLSRQEATALADGWFDKLDPEKTGKVTQADFTTRFASLLTPAPARGGASAAATVPQGRDTQLGTWPEFNKMIGGFFKFHWVDPQLITVKIDDPKSPLTAMFHGQEFEIRDETYTFGMDTWSRENLHILTSIDYSKMSPEDKAKESYPRADHDYGLSWIHREGKGRVFYEAHGHSERIYAIKPMLEHVLAGIQYAIGDLKADDTPSAKAGTR